MQALALHQALDRAACDGHALTAQLPLNLVDTIDLHVRLPDAFNFWRQNVIPFGPVASLGRIELHGCMASVSRRGDLQHFADRLDPTGLPVLVHERPQDFKQRSSSAWAKNALASFKISLALRSSLTSRSRSLTRWASPVVKPLPWP